MKVTNLLILLPVDIYCHVADMEQPTQEAVDENVIYPAQSTSSVEECSGFVLVTDNVDKNIRPSYQQENRQTQLLSFLCRQDSCLCYGAA